MDPDLLRAIEEFHTGVTNGALRVSVTHLCGDDCTFEALVAFAQVSRISPRVSRSLYLYRERVLTIRHDKLLLCPKYCRCHVTAYDVKRLF